MFFGAIDALFARSDLRLAAFCGLGNADYRGSSIGA
ncbi:hypothetical protein BSS2_I1655 [Brucella suis bv. 1 str. S2]|uniref:Uncharacterized protein n=3 Tax=Brucella TaxID=234 RepID=Q2YRC5_BRUA2|nr:hypothetical protein BR1709 [Brucella suis 1330]AAX75013.1 hypothetical protein BruAb1_1694 [Brucella abortus bv. 1 str. 9-941]AEU06696.1 hypothetical protein BSVBI22_A1705 [Brucella suis VBI22]AHN47304.1 hypothetical protein BSS2_I1655 [Brucella suis bv. 1 str. S2]EFM63285.1 Hypothetical protein BROD_0635 [Brucella sp. NF 2653]CAJ11677.1 conserved hypothetical protein [Brucella abortus 2308]CDL77085.1 unnamed protein product [Brucella canis str. Oliveri]SHO31476.1 predicted protein [Bruc